MRGPAPPRARSVSGLPFMSAEKLEQARDAFAELCFGADQADYDVAVSREVVEMAGMHEDSMLLQELDRRILVRLGYRHAQDCVPPPLNLQARAGRLQIQLPVQFEQVGSYPLHQLPLNVLSLYK